LIAIREEDIRKDCRHEDNEPEPTVELSEGMLEEQPDQEERQHLRQHSL
jgi:hypothetical protein